MSLRYKEIEAIKEMINLGICDKNKFLVPDAVNIINSSIYNLISKGPYVIYYSVQHPVSLTARFKNLFKNK